MSKEKKTDIIRIRISNKDKKDVLTYCKENNIQVSKLLRQTLKTITQ